MRLTDVADVRLGNPSADFWLVRKGTPQAVGSPTRTYSAEAIGITVTETGVLNPDYLFYAMQHLHAQGRWEAVATGTTRLVSIRAQDVRNLPLG